MNQALGGGVTRSLALDAHGKSLSSALLDLEIDGAMRRYQRRPRSVTIASPDGMIMTQPPTLAALAADLDAGRTSARKLVDAMSRQDRRPGGRGRAGLHPCRHATPRSRPPRRWTRLRKVKAAPSPFAGIPVSIKDLFDIKGQVTRAGSRALDDNPPAEADAPAVARLRRAGFVVIGRTNMTEFAYSGIGINPHYGTPKGAWQRDVGHVPGGSSSGARGLGRRRHGAWRARHRHRRLLPDSGGLQRHRRLQADAAPGAARRRGAAVVHARQHRPAGAQRRSAAPRSTPCWPTSRSLPLQPRPVQGMRLAVPTTVALDDLDDAVAQAFERALEDAVARTAR